MKKLFIALMLCVWALGVSAQEKEIKITRVKKGEEPKAVMDALKKDFPEFIAQDLAYLPGKLYGEEWNINTQVNEYANATYYQITLKHSDGSYYTSVYDRNGKLLSSKQEIDNSKLPKEVLATVMKFVNAGWHIDRTHDIIKYTNKKSENTYKVKIEKGLEHKILFMNSRGDVINTRFSII